MKLSSWWILSRMENWKSSFFLIFSWNCLYFHNKISFSDSIDVPGISLWNDVGLFYRDIQITIFMLKVVLWRTKTVLNKNARWFKNTIQCPIRISFSELWKMSEMKIQHTGEDLCKEPLINWLERGVQLRLAMLSNSLPAPPWITLIDAPF